MVDQNEPSSDVIAEEVEQKESVESQNTSGDVIANENKTEESTQVEQTTEKHDEFWKNRSYELERKLGNISNELPKIIEETLAKQNTQKEEKYSVAQLEAYALEHPEHRPWVEEQKAKVIREETISLIKQQDEKRNQELLRQQSVAMVINDPKYSEAFTTNPLGQKVLNVQSPMGSYMAAYLQDPRVANQPDAFAIAAKLARADVIDSAVGQKDVALSTLKRQNAQLKQKTLVEGGGTNNVRPVKDSFQDAKERLSKTGTMADAQNAVTEYFKKVRG